MSNSAKANRTKERNGKHAASGKGIAVNMERLLAVSRPTVKGRFVLFFDSGQELRVSQDVGMRIIKTLTTGE